MLIRHSTDAALLSPEEAVLRYREENLAIVANRKLENQTELEDLDRSGGPQMPYRELIRRLAMCNPSLTFLDGSPGNIAVYVPKTRKELEEDGPDDSKSTFFNEHRYAGGFAKDLIPEYSHITVDEYGLPNREIRGWRTVLISMISSKVISYKNAVTHFGEAIGSRSTRWHKALHGMK